MPCTLNETICPSKITKLTWWWQNSSCFSQNEFIYWIKLTFYSDGALYWMKQLFMSKTNSTTNGYSLPKEHFPIVTGIELVICSQKLFKCMFLLALWTFCMWDPKLLFSRITGYVALLLEFFFRHTKVVRLHTVQHYAGEAVRTQSGKGPVYYNMVGRRPNSSCSVIWLDYSFSFT